MRQTPEAIKLAELRARTDHQLKRIILSRLESGFSLARRSAYKEAHCALLEVCQLLPVVDGLPEAERRLLSLRLEHLARILAAEDDCCAALA